MIKSATKKSPRCAYLTYRIIFHANLASNVFPNPAMKVFALLQPLKNKKAQQFAARNKQLSLGAYRASPPRSKQSQCTVSITGKSTRTSCTFARPFRTRPSTCATTRRRCRITIETLDRTTTIGYPPLMHNIASALHLRNTHHRNRRALNHLAIVPLLLAS
jgi:hypothetical protein